MGDFDRNPTAAKPNESRKLVIVLSLGALLIGLVALQFLKGGTGPQSASGAPVPSGSPLAPPVLANEISPAALDAMMNELKADPTTALLCQDLRGDHSLAAVPRNPFAMSDAWLKDLGSHPPQPAATRSSSTPPPATIPGVPALSLRVEDFKLATIVNSDMAVINGKIVKVGDVVAGARVLKIRNDGVTLQHVDSPGGPTIELSMQPRLNKN